MALTAGLAIGRASLVQPTVVLPPAAGAYTLAGTCISALDKCADNVVVSDFSTISDIQQNGNELVTVNAGYSANVFTDNGGVPGTLIGQLSLSGTAEFTFVGRNPSVNPLGTFPTELTGFDFTGTLNGNSFEVKENPGSSSTGTTTILEATFTPPIEYSVTSSLNVFGEFSFNGGPFMTAPGQTTTLIPTPEPGADALAAPILAVVLGIASRLPRIRRAD
jgi:hypothetical protein